ncbi:hypothetical protein B0J12DRAFT_677704 [Macrophomina phaseolina]|uniref:Uncharacterized protein n=1 Tax=Macrophomina phaseolina TaxID=35725 RepID=A0ABQ8FYU9_9PEZI|nr:hypothetical protein B0J12DRAFT_677704 [Macrophomina phaseolina]
MLIRSAVSGGMLQTPGLARSQAAAAAAVRARRQRPTPALYLAPPRPGLDVSGRSHKPAFAQTSSSVLLRPRSPPRRRAAAAAAAAATPVLVQQHPQSGASSAGSAIASPRRDAPGPAVVPYFAVALRHPVQRAPRFPSPASSSAQRARGVRLREQAVSAHRGPVGGVPLASIPYRLPSAFRHSSRGRWPIARSTKFGSEEYLSRRSAKP